MIVYKLTSPSNKCYIGLTKHTLEQRVRGHETLANKNKGYYLHKAIRKYGIENFKKEILFECDDLEFIKLKEKFFIKQFMSNDNNFGYNETTGGDGTGGHKINQSQRHFLVEYNKKYGHPCLGRSMPESQKEAIRKKLIGRKQSEESIKKRVKSGWKQSEYQKKTISNANSKNWTIFYPDGKEEIIKNLTSFCKQHQLDPGNLMKTISGKIKSHKGFRCSNSF